MTDPRNAAVERAVITVESASADETRRLGEVLGRAASPGDVFLLRGPFGAGKTVFVQGLARGLGVESQVTSPSFVLVSEHQGRIALAHVDLFRIDRPEQALRESLYEYLEGDWVTAIEWPDRLALPVGIPATTVELAVRDDGRRVLIVRPASAQLLAAVRAAGIAVG